MKVAVIGGGAAGFFSAFSSKEHHPDAEVFLYEKSDKILSKVKISGGGRCNVTHACFQPSSLSKFYPRGAKSLKKAFKLFQPRDTIKWFSDRDISLKIESDNRMFPISDNSQTIVDCFLRELQIKKIELIKNARILELIPNINGYYLCFKNHKIHFDKVIIASGGSPKSGGFDWLKNLGHNIISPVPSLFTFNMPNESITKLMGLVVENATVRIQGTKLEYQGPLLITHWGMSGPVILKLSSWGARFLHERNYECNVQINWISIKSEKDVFHFFSEKFDSLKRKKIVNANPFSLPNRIWLYFLDKLQICPNSIWLDLSKKNLNRLINILLNDVYEVSGKTTFKDEFVTCGGVSMEDVQEKTMQSKVCPNIYFAGEVLNIDGITGGFNFQSAWTTGFIAGKLEQ
jgi:hypothetical protein